MKKNELTLTIFRKLPANIKPSIPKKEEIVKAELKEENKDTITKKEKIYRKSWIIFIGIMVLVLTIFLFYGDKRERHTISINKDHIQEATKEATSHISTEDLEEIMLAGNSTEPHKLKNYKVGDDVSYKNTISNSVQKNNSDRKYNVPLLVVSDQGSQYSSLTSAPKLPIPKNAYLRAYLDRDVSSKNLEVPVTAVTYTDLIANGNLLIPKNSKLVGKAYQEKDSDRIGVYFNYVVMPNGKEYSIKGVALGEDNITGLPTEHDYKLASKGGSVLATSLLGAASTTASVAGDSFGTIFAGELAGNTSDSLGNAIDYKSQFNGISVMSPMNTKLKVLFL